MSKTFLNYDLMEAFDAAQFQNRKPYPWFDFHQVLTPEGFRELYENFPSLDLFENHNGIARAHGQRPHNRYYLAYGSSVYHSESEKKDGSAQHEELPLSWQQFMDELQNSERYHNFIKKLYGVDEFRARFAWHVGVAGSEVSPHLDGKKIGTHIFYFNTSDDWEESWGGSTLVLEGKTKGVMNPEFSDFQNAVPARLTDNHSFLFKNTPCAWHGTQALSCPEGKYRRLFNVIYEYSSPEALRRAQESGQAPSDFDMHGAGMKTNGQSANNGKISLPGGFKRLSRKLLGRS